ncbi:hypothetical protein EJ04DRAFT_600752 [Polyplosphaeria fusca]|uniref:AA9 family lytic polysaccharide monooxygenase n=1 Tax=Polyplosphaeria fusca TaxID=682080 RepID=A0A9P4RBY5_9PLEO|nr:hypothetical protein EJ04DRAFT_600752 [Polyplosphaeria fusca]
MKLSLLCAMAVGMTPFASAHYFFDVLIINGKETGHQQYVRENDRPLKYFPTKWKPVYDNLTPDGTDFRCNRGTFPSASRTQTATVKAGDKIGMKLAVGATMQHPGPELVYMSRVPSGKTAATYQGDGDWFKVFEQGVCRQGADFTRNAWCTWDRNKIEFTIPKDLPDGEYLIRPEHIGLHEAHVSQAEFYYACAQVKVTGGGSGRPGPMIRFPGGYRSTDSSFNFNIYNGYKAYTMPGPAVWKGGKFMAKRYSNTSVDVIVEAKPAKLARDSRTFREAMQEE